MSLLLQGLGGGEVPWNLVLYYEPALITASSRIRYVHVCACACVRHLCVCVCACGSCLATQTLSLNDLK